MTLLPLPFLITSLLDITAWRQLLPKGQVSLTPLLRIHIGSEAVLQSVPGGFALSDALKTLLLKRRFNVLPYETIGSLIMRHWMIGIAEIVYIFSAPALGLMGTPYLGEELVKHQATLLVSIGLLVLVSIALDIVVNKLIRGTLASTIWKLLNRLPSQLLRRWLNAKHKSFGEADLHFKAIGRKSRWILSHDLFQPGATMRKLELELRAQQINLLLTDCDGVLTDTGVYYSESGELMKRFSIRDGMGVALLRKAGIETGIISGETSESLQRRAEKLHIAQLHLGISDKVQRVRYIADLSGLSLSQIGYIGDDVNDLELMVLLKEFSIVGAPADAVLPVRRIAHYVCANDGGQGAFREFADWILELRGTTATVERTEKDDNHSFIRILSMNGAL